MTTTDSFDRRLAAWLSQETEGRVADHLAEVLVTTRATRQRPGWSSPGRWLPMDIPLRLQFAPAPRLVRLLVVLAVLIAIAAVAVSIGTRPRFPAPYGPAANGEILYGDGDIVAFDPATGTSTPLVTGPTVDSHPFFSRDGSHFAFQRAAGGNLSQLYLAMADGTVVTWLTKPVVVEWADWSPDGKSLVVADSSSSTFSIVGIDPTTPARVVNLDVEAGRLQADRIYWRPDGRDLVFRGSTNPEVAPWGLYLVNADGTGLRPISKSIVHKDFQEPALSPDGTRVMYADWSRTGGHLYVANIADGSVERLIFDDGRWSDYHPSYSPDGTSIVFNRGRPQESYHLAVAPAGGGPVVDLGSDRPWEAGAIAAFSPDGLQVIARYDNGSTWIYDPADGSGRMLGVGTVPWLMTWQRVLVP